MRSQIACAHCRRSKVKCENTGTDSVCKACRNQNRECTYPESGSSGARRESIVDRTGEAPKKRQKKTAASSSQIHHLLKKESPPAFSNDPLDPLVLTPQVWNELFDIFQQHFATDLPFLHAPTFRNEVSNLPPLLLLSFLALTARFHPTLVERHSGDPIKAAEYYQKAATPHLVKLGDPKLTTIQALLMLGLHEWGMNHGASAWRLIKDAIHCAQYLNLHMLDEEPDARTPSNLKPNSRRSQSNPQSKKEEIIENEIKRRTFWGCFIMDCYLSVSNKYRPPSLYAKDICVQLPCSDHAFIFGHEVDTMMLDEDEKTAEARFERLNQLRRAAARLGREQANGHNTDSGYYHSWNDRFDEPRKEIGEREDFLSRFIRALDLYGKVRRWVCSGGRRQSDHIRFAPWNPKSPFFDFESRLHRLQDQLPRDFALTPQNTDAHIDTRTSRSYTLMHVLHLLMNIMLYREYLAFLPFGIERPIGPLDEPKIPADQGEPLEGPERYWAKQAGDCFGSARNIIDLLSACQSKNVLVETPLIGFATWLAVTCCIYCSHFPKMDVYNSMRTRSAGGDGHEEIDTRGIVMIGNMQKRLYMSHGWNKGVEDLNKRIAKTAIKWQKGALKDYGRGEWEKLEHLLNDFEGYRIYQEEDEQDYVPDSSPELKDTDESSKPRHTLKRERSWDGGRGPRTDNNQGYQWTTVNSFNNSASTVKPEAEEKGSDAPSGFQQPFQQQQNGHSADVNMSASSGNYRSYAPASDNQHHVHGHGSIHGQSLQQSSVKPSQASQKYGYSVGDSWHGLEGVYVFPDDMLNASFATREQLLSFHSAYNPIEVMGQSWA